jgi:hypothetical protein
MEVNKKYADYFAKSEKLKERGVIVESQTDTHVVFTVKDGANVTSNVKAIAGRIIRMPIPEHFDTKVANSIVDGVSGNIDRSLLVEE